MFRVGAIALGVWLAWRGWQTVQDNPILTLIYCIAAGVVAGLFFICRILPWMAEALGMAIFSSGEKVQATESEADDDDPERRRPPDDGGPG